MYCHHCGMKLPEGAKFCPDCGGKTALHFIEPSPEKTMVEEKNAIPDSVRTCAEPQNDFITPVNETGSLMVTRQKKGPRKKTFIYVDKIQRNQVENGESVIIEMPAGIHRIMIETAGFGKKEDTVDIVPGKITAYKFELASFEPQGHKIISNGIEGTESQKKESFMDKLVKEPQVMPNGERRCPHCGGLMAPQTVTEYRKAGCFTVLLYIILCLTVLGILIVIPLALRKKTETVTYMVCQQCGRRQRLFGVW